MNIGPIYFAPTFELSNLGVDRNVFNDETNPKRDLTGTLSMKSLVGLHFGEAVVFQVVQSNSYNYFRRYRSERSVDSGLNFLLEYRSHVFRPWIRYEKVTTSQRQGVELDARAERKVPNFDLGLDLTAGFRLGASFAARRTTTTYNDEETFNGVKLGEVLDSRLEAYQGFLRYELTDLTDFIIGTDYMRDRFAKSPIRDNDSYYYYAGLRSNSGAVVVGSATVGFRQMTHKDQSVPDFKGVTADVNLFFVPSEYLRVDLTGGRDLGYSYLEKYPFFVQSTGGITLTNRFSDHLDWVLSGKGTWLNYDETVTGLKDPHTDRTVVGGLGAGYYLAGGAGARIGILFERAQRWSPIAGRSYVTNRLSTNYRVSF
jgi:hypothetical protein